jgi:hypothetical protein
METKSKIGIVAVAGLLAGLGFWSSRGRWATKATLEQVPPAAASVRAKPMAAPRSTIVTAAGSQVQPVDGADGVLAPEKRAQVEKIRRDYEDIRAKASADYTAAGATFPGGVNAFLRQLALLELEMRADLAKALTPRELENYLMDESTTGQTLRRRLEGTAATEEQRRAVFRVQQEFDDRFSLVFDVSPPALLERAKVRQAAREMVRATLGDEIYAAWEQADDGSYMAMRVLVRQRGLPAAAVGQVWALKDDWLLRKLEIAAQPGLTVEQRTAMQGALNDQTRARVTALLGEEAFSPGSEAFGWLPDGR